MSTRLTNSVKLTALLSKSRTDAGKSQKYMAQALGKSVGTIQNWEAGLGAPNLLDVMEWFNAVDRNPLRYFLDYMYPDFYDGLTAEAEDEIIKNSLLQYIQEVATNSEIRKLAYSIFGNTGSSWRAQLDMLTAHNHCSMKSRVNAAQIIYNSYEMEKANNELVGTEHIMPDEENLKNAIAEGKAAVFEKKSSYLT